MNKRNVILSCRFCKNFEVDDIGDWTYSCDLTNKEVEIFDDSNFKVCDKFEFKRYRDIKKECTKKCSCYDECISSYLDFIENSLNCYDFECQCGCGYSFKSCDENCYCPKCSFPVTKV